MVESVTTILDHKENISAPGDVFANPANEYYALMCLRHGMEFIYRQAKRCDLTVNEAINPNGDIKFVGFGNAPEFSAVPMTLLTVSFHWYAMSAYQYALLVGVR